MKADYSGTNLALPYSSYLSLDRYDGNYTYPVTFGGYSDCVQINPSLNYKLDTYQRWVGIDELNGAWTAFSPGDHVYWSCWVWVGDSTAGDNGIAQDGFFFAMDAYGVYRICELDGASGHEDSVGWGADVPADYVAMGTNTWTHVYMDFYVNATYITQGTTGSYLDGSVQVPCGFITEMGIHSTPEHEFQENATCWVRNFQLYINPSGSSGKGSSSSLSSTLTHTPTPAQISNNGGSGGGGGGGSVNDYSLSPSPTAHSQASAFSDVSTVLNGISDSGRLFLVLAIGAVAFLFVGAGKKR